MTHSTVVLSANQSPAERVNAGLAVLCLELAERLLEYIDCGPDIFEEYSDDDLSRAQTLCDEYFSTLSDPGNVLVHLLDYRHALDDEKEEREERAEEARAMASWDGCEQRRDDRADEAYVRGGYGGRSIHAAL
jgi:hypothetical protein